MKENNDNFEKPRESGQDTRNEALEAGRVREREIAGADQAAADDFTIAMESISEHLYEKPLYASQGRDISINRVEAYMQGEIQALTKKLEYNAQSAAEEGKYRQEQSLRKLIETLKRYEDCCSRVSELVIHHPALSRAFFNAYPGIAQDFKRAAESYAKWKEYG